MAAWAAATRMTRAEIATRYCMGSRSQLLLEGVRDAQQRRLDPAIAGLRQHGGRDERDPDVRDDRGHQPDADQPPQPARGRSRTWPASPEEASMPLNATSTSGKAKTMSSSEG